jgi:hypothetical protein
MFSLPAGSIVTSATLDLIVPSTVLNGVSTPFIDTFNTFAQPDPFNTVHIAPALDTVGASHVKVFGLLLGTSTQDLFGMADGNSTITVWRQAAGKRRPGDFFAEKTKMWMRFVKQGEWVEPSKPQ